MKPHDLPIDDACRQALAALEADPLDLPPEAETHLRHCPACAETRVLWLAQEDAPAVLVPAGYFDRLPERVLRKLPSRSRRSRALFWAAAAALVGAAALGGFWAGRMNRTPVVEATGPKPVVDFQEIPTESPFIDGEDPLLTLQDMKPEDSKALLKRLDRKPETPAAP